VYAVLERSRDEEWAERDERVRSEVSFNSSSCSRSSEAGMSSVLSLLPFTLPTPFDKPVVLFTILLALLYSLSMGLFSFRKPLDVKDMVRYVPSALLTPCDAC
jgi:hypothetical protein